MEAKDNPEKLSFVRAGEAVVAASTTLAKWASVLEGRALAEFMTGKWSPAATEAYQRRRGTGLQVGVTRGGKAVDDA